MRDALNPFKHEGHKDQEGKTLVPLVSARSRFLGFVFRIVSPENIWAFLFFLIVIALIVFTTDDSPVWIYQGF
jgi:hypothetical protein